MNINTITTENGDVALASSGNCNLDFFTRITRSASFADYMETFIKAWNEDKVTAIKVLMNMRDVRTGKGEKLIPIVIMYYLKINLASAVYESILTTLLSYGYWKDLLKIHAIECHVRQADNQPQPINPIEIELFAQQLAKDLTLIELSTNDKKATISLCAKWAPSEKSHYDSKPIYAAKKIRQTMKMSPKEYRVCLSKLRKHIGVLEMYMATKQYNLIDFSQVPSVAMMKMKHAFSRDCNADNVESPDRVQLHLSYCDFLKALAESKTKVNVKGIQPHELVSTYFGTSTIDPLVEQQWKAIKANVKSSGVFSNVTAIVDVSGSMSGVPMQVAIALGILVAECTTGVYHGKIITFDSNPKWHHLVGTSLMEQVHCVKNAPWGGSTNLRATSDLILREAVNANLAQNEMVKTLFIFTDMQFDSATGYNNGCTNESTFDYAKRIFNEKGYNLPHIVCWNLRTSSNKTMPVSQSEEHYAMLSGFSSELLKCILTAEDFTPVSMMMHVLEPYQNCDGIQGCDNIKIDPESYVNIESATDQSAIKKAFRKSTKHR